MMFRFSLLSLFLTSAATARVITSTRDLQGNLLEDIDLESLKFNFGGITFSATEAQQTCPNEFSQVVNCLLTDCPQFLDVCPDLTNLPPSFVGSAAPAASPVAATPTAATPTDATPTAASPTVSVVTATNATATNDTATSDARFLQAATTEPIPECDELEDMFCEFLGGEDISECCLTDCTSQFQALLVCYVKATTGEDRSDCEVPVCPTLTPVETTSTEKPAPPKPASGAVLTSGSRMAALTASLLAFAVL